MIFENVAVEIKIGQIQFIISVLIRQKPIIEILAIIEHKPRYYKKLVKRVRDAVTFVNMPPSDLNQY